MRVMKSRRLMGLTPRPRITELSIAGVGVGRWRASHKKPKKVWPEPYGRAGLEKRRSVISITDAGEMPVYSHSQELDRDGPDAFPFLALARIRSSRSCGAVNRRRVYSGACVGHLNRRLEWQRHDFSPGKLQTMPTSHARGSGDYSDRLRTGTCCLCLY